MSTIRSLIELYRPDFVSKMQSNDQFKAYLDKQLTGQNLIDLISQMNESNNTDRYWNKYEIVPLKDHFNRFLMGNLGYNQGNPEGLWILGGSKIRRLSKKRKLSKKRTRRISKK